MKLRDIFERYTRDELKLMCMNLNISGYMKLDKPKLVELIFQYMNNKDTFIELFKSLCDLCLFFLSLIGKVGKNETVDSTKKSYIRNFSLQTFNDNLKIFYILSQIFIGEDKGGNGILMIPDDTLPWFKEFFEENQSNIISNLKEIERELLQLE
jgi:hypothetical protein